MHSFTNSGEIEKNYATISTNSGRVVGHHNVISCHSSNIKGNFNKITGHNNTIEGDHNVICGHNNVAKGRDNSIRGFNNKIINNDHNEIEDKNFNMNMNINDNNQNNKNNSKNNNNNNNSKNNNNNGDKNERVVMNECEKEFERFWKHSIKLGRIGSEYYERVCHLGLNDIRLLCYFDENSLKNEIKTTEIHCKFILQKIKQFSNDMKIFQEWLKLLCLSRDYYHNAFEPNGILTLDSFRFHIQSRSLLFSIMDQNKGMIEKDCDVVWNASSNINDEIYNLLQLSIQQNQNDNESDCNENHNNNQDSQIEGH